MREQLDPAVVHGRRETLVILTAAAVCLAWSVGCSYLLGYPTQVGGPVAKVLGMPSWVFWGVAVPWIAADLFAVWFCFFFIADDPLDEAEDEAESDDHTAGRDEPGQGGPS